MGSRMTTRRYRGREDTDRSAENDERMHRHLVPRPDAFSFVPPENLVVNFRNEYHAEKRLGSGHTSTVYLMIQTSTGQRCAVKRMSRHHKRSITLSFQREAQILQEIEHNHIVRLLGVYVDCTHFYIAQEVCTGGTLWDRVNRVPLLKEEEVVDVSYQILDAVKFLHNRNIVHRDIKPSNIMYKNLASSQIVLVDFGSSRKIRDTDEFKDWVGTPVYMAPEVTRRRTGAELKKVDMWAVGITVYILVTNHVPFFGKDRVELIRDICQRPLVFPGESGTTVSRRFIASLLRRNVERRLSAAEAIQHEWLEPARKRASEYGENASSDDDDSNEFKQVVDFDCVDEATISLIDANDGENHEEDDYVELFRERKTSANRPKISGKVLLELASDEKTLGKEGNSDVLKGGVEEKVDVKMIGEVDRHVNVVCHTLIA